MITDLPIYVYLTFFAAVIYVLIMFYYATHKNTPLLIGIILWGVLNSLLASMGVFENTKTMPPGFIIMILPVLIFILTSIFSKNVKNWLATLNLKQITYLHFVRVPVELVLFWLFVGEYVPELMTFEGRNFDILIGLTAPIVALIAFRGERINKTLLWVWNVLSIILLINIVVNAILSIPTSFQQFAFDQPNTAIIKFPFLLLPSIIVLLVFVSNIASFVILKRKNKLEKTTDFIKN